MVINRSNVRIAVRFQWGHTLGNRPAHALNSGGKSKSRKCKMQFVLGDMFKTAGENKR